MRMGLTMGTLVAILAVTTTGCTTQRYWGGSTAVGNNTQAKIGLVTKTDTNPYFVALRQAAQAEASKLGAQFTALAGKFDGDNDGQVTAIENLVQRGVNTILITPNSATGVLSAIKQARDKGIMVIALDTETDPATAVDATYATDNTAAGRQEGQYVKAVLGDKPPQLLMLDGTAGSTVDTQRHTGFLQGFGLSDGDPAIIGHQSVNGDQSQAQQGMENLLQRATSVNAVYTLNEPTARGAYAALQARGLLNQVVMGSIDGGCQGVQDVKDGKYGATVMQFPAKMAALGVDAAVEYAKSGKKPSGFQNTGSMVITDKPVPGIPSQDTAWGLQNCWGK
ncbi:substrate-binding domain-containing protein [Kutzneria kofuensis]|uniref:Fructose transport system substrate-binding protein n=1 Tax=Kutzneria kofuensis TaxID=103725 RepID=A0A7W9KI63_9PSEU|nr:substrate-binding domain-containing protein [Kutzneria kofuensis]MBB5892840.1 fructose transport system substrate-binding protein [Kutzneria kofuensis]